MIKFASAICALFLSVSVQAAPVDFIDQGDYTTDTISGLDFRSAVQHTAFGGDHTGQPVIDDFFAVGAEFEGWRLGTIAELRAIIENYTGIGTINSAPLWGLTDFMLDPRIMLISQAETGSWFYDAHLADGDVALESRGNLSGPYNERANFGNIDLYFIHEHFIVRGDFTPVAAVPLPPALLMFLPALMGLIGFRNKISN